MIVCNKCEKENIKKHFYRGHDVDLCDECFETYKGEMIEAVSKVSKDKGVELNKIDKKWKITNKLNK